jgi:hypothetical protein
MRNTAVFTIFAILVCCVFSGCVSSTPVAPQRPAALPVMKAADKVVKARKKAFANACRGSKIRGVVVYPLSWKDVPADEVVRKAASYGFNSMYFVISSEVELDSHLEELCISAVKSGIAPHIVLRQRDYFKRFRGNAFVRSFKTEYPDIVEVSRRVAEFSDNLGDEGKIAGFSIILEPHRFNAVEQRRGGVDNCFIWDNKNFGPGSDNDMLMKKSFADAALAANESDIAFVPVIADFYHEWAKDGKLSCGKITDTAKLSTSKKDVLLLSTGNKPTAVAAQIKDEFADADDTKITLVIMVADHLSVNESAFRRRNFSDFLNGIKYGTGKLKSLKAFNGLVTGPLRALEYMCHEEE